MRAFAIHQRGDYIAQCRERQVDLGCLLQPLTCCTCLGLPFRTLYKHKSFLFLILHFKKTSKKGYFELPYWGRLLTSVSKMQTIECIFNTSLNFSFISLIMPVSIIMNQKKFSLHLMPDEKETYCQINKMQLANADMLLSICSFFTTLYGQSKYSMRSWAVKVHVCCPYRPCSRKVTWHALFGTICPIYYFL